MKFEEYYKSVKPLIDRKLAEVFGVEDEVIRKVFEFSVEGGKRFRPTLVVLSSDCLSGDRNRL
jgi:geranylgeranyl pyrophosphate synthase